MLKYLSFRILLALLIWVTLMAAAYLLGYL